MASIKDNNQVVNDDLGKLRLPCTRTAVLVRDGDISHNFICYACQRVGYNVRLFTRQDEAIA